MRMFTALSAFLVLWIALCALFPPLSAAAPPSSTTASAPSLASIAPLQHRQISDFSLTEFLFVSDIDGNLHGIHRSTGAHIWTLPLDEPLVRILANVSADKYPQSDILWFVEPYADGTLYYFSPQFGLNKLPTTIKDLVMQSPFSLGSDDKIYTGTRKTSLYSISVRLGKVQSSFGLDDKCPAPNTHYNIDSTINGDRDTILVGKTTFELSIFSKSDRSVVWNVSYSQWGPNNIDQDLAAQNHISGDNLHFSPFYDTSLLAVKRDLGLAAWVTKIPSAPVNMFDVFFNRQNGEYVLLPQPRLPTNSLQIKSDPFHKSDRVFINKTSNGKEWFAMSSENYPSLVNSSPLLKYELDLLQWERSGKGEYMYLQDFSISGSSPKAVENLLCGVHNSKSLTSSAQYRPASRFAGYSHVPQIGDGHTGDLILRSPRQLLPATPQHFINGMRFPELTPGLGSDLIVVHGEPQVAAEKVDAPPIPEKDAPLSESWLLQRLLLRRIVEDLLVLSVILILILLFGDPVRYIYVVRSALISKWTQQSENHPADIIQEFFAPAENDAITDVTDSAESNQTLVEKDRRDSQDSTEEIKESADNAEESAAEEEQVFRRRKRGTRGAGKRGGKKQKPKVADLAANDDSATAFNSDAEETASPGNDNPVTLPPTGRDPSNYPMDKNLTISDKVLGYGSHGTVVYQGTFENRPVAVKRMLLDFYDVASHEVRLLQESDDHPHVIRYFCSQLSATEKFLYIALELCLCSLDDIIEKPQQYLSLRMPKLNHVLYQLAGGLHYLHLLHIIHRDLKPQNILVAAAKHDDRLQLVQPHQENNVRLVISDFGLCKKLESDQSSFRATTNYAALGTLGWRGPELLLQPDQGYYGESASLSLASSEEAGEKRLTRTLDIFSLGCVFFYILTAGLHPFGDRYMREANIIRGEYNLKPLEHKCPRDSVAASDLIGKMISANPCDRPLTGVILRHPLFWLDQKKLDFMLKVSDRFEIEQRDPPLVLLQNLEARGKIVHGGDWHARFDQEFLDHLGKYRKYHTHRLMDLLRAMRNKYHHFNDMPTSLQLQMSPLPGGFYEYFIKKFPNLLMQTYYCVAENICEEHMFSEYF